MYFLPPRQYIRNFQMPKKQGSCNATFGGPILLESAYFKMVVCKFWCFIPKVNISGENCYIMMPLTGADHLVRNAHIQGINTQYRTRNNSKYLGSILCELQICWLFPMYQLMYCSQIEYLKCFNFHYFGVTLSRCAHSSTSGQLTLNCY